MTRTGRASTLEKERLRKERIRATMKEHAKRKFRERSGRYERRRVYISATYRLEGGGRRTPDLRQEVVPIEIGHAPDFGEAEERLDREHAGHVHFGVTISDVVDYDGDD